jgi:hypothetical protein
MKECDAWESNSTTTESVIDGKHTNDNIWSFLGFLHSNMVGSPTCIVLLGSNRNRVSPTGRCRCRHNYLRRVGGWIGALVGIVTSFTTSIAVPFRRRWVYSSLGPLNILISSTRSLEIVGALNHLAMWGRESLSSWVRPLLKQRLRRMEHKSS